jgi:hypothetical protein
MPAPASLEISVHKKEAPLGRPHVTILPFLMPTPKTTSGFSSKDLISRGRQEYSEIPI